MTKYGIILSDDGQLEWLREWKNGEWRNREFKTVEEAEIYIKTEGILGNLDVWRVYIAGIEKSFRIKTKKTYGVEEEK